MELFYKTYGQGEPALVILHGLLGSGRNWHTVAKRLAQHRRVIVPDLRNHGRSPHSPQHGLLDMAQDVVDLQHRLDAAPAVILGHSMGGMVAMAMSFHMPEVVRGVIVVDIALRPHRGGVHEVLEVLSRLDLAAMAGKDEVDAALRVSIPSTLVRQFILTNLVTTADGLQWRVNLPALRAFLTESQAFRPAPLDIFEGPALFIRGGQSDYLRDADFDLIRHHFPNARIETVANAGHWVHYDAAAALIALVQDFCRASGVLPGKVKI